MKLRRIAVSWRGEVPAVRVVVLMRLCSGVAPLLGERKKEDREGLGC